MEFLRESGGSVAVWNFRNFCNCSDEAQLALDEFLLGGVQLGVGGKPFECVRFVGLNEVGVQPVCGKRSAQR